MSVSDLPFLLMTWARSSDFLQHNPILDLLPLTSDEEIKQHQFHVEMPVSSVGQSRS